MKYLLTSLLIFSTMSMVSAQEADDKEPRLYSNAVGGSFFTQFSSNERSNRLSKTTYINIQPYFITDLNDRLSFGGLLSYDRRKSETISTTTSGNSAEATETEFGFGIVNRVYLKQGRIQIFLQNQVRYSIIRGKAIYSSFSQENYDATQNKYYTEISPAIAYQLNRLRLMASLTGLSYSIAGDKMDRDTNELISENSQAFTISLSPKYLRIGAEFLF